LKGSTGKKLKKKDNRKKKTIKRSSQGNSQGGSQQRYYRDGQIRNTKDKGKENERKTEDNRKIPWDKET